MNVRRPTGCELGMSVSPTTKQASQYNGPTGKRIRKKYEAARNTNHDIQQEILRYLTMCLFLAFCSAWSS